MDYSFQLYCARNFPPVTAILPRLKSLGYTQTEGFGGLFGEPESLAEALKASGLTMPSGHFGLDMLKDTDTAMKTAETLGITTLICPAIPQDQRAQAEAGWVALAETLAGLAETYRKAGFAFGWHNHAFEFLPTETGRLPLEIILDTAPALIWECDVAWVVRGRHDPIAWLQRYAPRVAAIHVKDIAPEGQCADEDGWADVGQGVIDWKTVMGFVRSETRAELFVMEHDNPNDVERFARRSIQFCRSLED
ncbi:MAG: sugar phosphate isomerase/epimerase [Alphaproteobacteria bacterium]|nr:sugar phosphate isomerase/epimerase [Alphaproteobacteria bacterium]